MVPGRSLTKKQLQKEGSSLPGESVSCAGMSGPAAASNAAVGTKTVASRRIAHHDSNELQEVQSNAELQALEPRHSDTSPQLLSGTAFCRQPESVR